MANGYSYVALLDVLGYKSQVESDRQHGNLAFKDKLSASLNVLHELNEDEIRKVAISDTVILSTGDATGLEKLLNACCLLFKSFMEHDLLLRGGVAYAQHFHAGNVTYSHALTIAHSLEHSDAIWPRILVDQGALDASKANGFDVDGKGLVLKWNGRNVLNVAKDDGWNKLYECSKRMFGNFKEDLEESVFTKYLLLEKFLLEHPDKPRGKRGFLPRPKVI